jgi:Zn finger protein HypA/HybF involved in hydrogenase expression
MKPRNDNEIGVISMHTEEPVDSDTAYCPECDEEYWLPEITEKCQICGSDKLTFTGG